MSWGRYILLKTVVGFGLFIVSVMPIFFLVGLVGSQMPKAAGMVAFALVALVWLIAMLLGTEIITEKVTKRWSR
ncbi:hypothetical protein [Stakelama pacifica]|uniref:Uncharacterized protein n=1 Tax=Stakelama pacifica TaxID=517720 RepID=A0A4R6FJB7_9SPHN|nr:hypothetical protein [Stakelama pacifica]TDN80615.1 hypothetical protein EV664_1093 [Stakelama pacifica]GGO97640.1 hypothetical protein GCM10011329_26990 [Stakelama pacifica]